MANTNSEARVYVDQFSSSGWGKWNGGGHMLTNNIFALHDMARRIGLKRAWFQRDSRFVHYDLTASKRKLAVEFGAIEIEFGTIPDDVLMFSPSGSFRRYGDRLAKI